MVPASFIAATARAMRKALMQRYVMPYALCHSVASHPLADGDDLLAVQRPPGHRSTTRTLSHGHALVHDWVYIKPIAARRLKLMLQRQLSCRERPLVLPHFVDGDVRRRKFRVSKHAHRHDNETWQSVGFPVNRRGAHRTEIESG